MPRKILLHSLLVCLCLADSARAQGKPSEAIRQITAQQQKAGDAAGRERRAGADDAEARLETLRAAAAARAAAFKVADWKGEELYALGVLHHWAEQFASAAEAFNAYLAGGAQGEEAFYARLLLTRALLETGRIEEAAKLLEDRRVEILDAVGYITRVGLHRDLALAFRDRNWNEPAVAQARAAYTMLQRLPGPAALDPQLAISREQDQAALAALIVTSLGRLGRRAEAERFHREAVSRDFARQPSLQALYEAELTSARLIGQPPPELAVKRWLDGSPLSFGELKGQVVLLDFWAMWCGPCAAAFPRLRELQEKYGGRGLRVIGVTRLYGRSDESADLSVAQEWEGLAAFRRKHRLDYPQAVAGQDDPTNDERFGIFSLPTAVVIDRAGQVRAVKRGAGEYRRLERLVTQLLGDGGQ